MKKGTLLNADISRVIASLGHFDAITICDAGLPIPRNVERIDLALTKGIPGFLYTVQAVLSEMKLESVELAEEFATVSPALHDDLLSTIRKIEGDIPVEYVPHERFKENTRKCVAVIRTGECTPYANVTLKSGVVF